MVQLDSQMDNGTLTHNSTLQAEGCFDNKNARTAKITACIAVMVITIVLNSLVIYPVYKYKRMRKNINYFIINMAISDILLASLTNIFIAEQMISGSWNWKIPGLAGRLTCKLMFFMVTMLLLVSPLTLFLMTFERYRAVTSMTMANGMSYSTRCLCLSMCWIIPSLLYAVELFRVDLYTFQNNSYCITKNIPAVFNYLIGLFTFYVFLYVVVFLLGFLILRRLRKSEESINVSEARQRKRRSQKIRSAVRMVLCSLVSFVVLSTPYHVFVFFDQLYPEKTSCKARINLNFLFRYLISLNSALSPCIYFIFISDFRRFLHGVYSSPRRDLVLETELVPVESPSKRLLSR